MSKSLSPDPNMLSERLRLVNDEIVWMGLDPVHDLDSDKIDPLTERFRATLVAVHVTQVLEAER